MKPSAQKFWHWLLWRTPRPGGRMGGPEILTFANWWALLHVGVGWALSAVCAKPLELAAASVLLPMVGILVGLSFAWAASAQSLLQTDEYLEIAAEAKRGIEKMPFQFLTAVLIMLTGVVVWGIAALGIFDATWPTGKHPVWYARVEWGIYAMTSLTIRSCWQIVLASQTVLVMRMRIMAAKNGHSLQEKEDPLSLPEAVTKEEATRPQVQRIRT